MRWTKALCLTALAAWATAPHALAQIPRPSGTPTPPPTVPGYVATVEITALAPDLKPPAAADTRALVVEARGGTRLDARIYLAEDLSRVEVLSTDFILPRGAFLLHKAGERFYAVADPQTKTYFAMDASRRMSAPSSLRLAARYVASRPVSTATSISASSSWIAWKSRIGRPNCCRSAA